MADLTNAKRVYLKNMQGQYLIPYTEGGSTVSPRNIGELVYSSLPLTDANLHLVDGSLLNGSGIYASFVSHIATLYADSLNAGLFITESEWQTQVNTYGVCGKYVYDSTNNTVRLPKITGIIEGTIDLSALGDLVQQTLPNIKGTTSYLSDNDSETALANGAFSSKSGTVYKRLRTADTSTGSIALSFNASDSNSVYQDGAKVQPQTIKAFVYMVIATDNGSNSTVSVNINNIATDVNGKLDTSLSNISATGIANIRHHSMPDYTAGISFSSGYTATQAFKGYAETGTGGGSVLVDGHVVMKFGVEGCGAQFDVPNGGTITTTGTLTSCVLYPIN